MVSDVLQFKVELKKPYIDDSLMEGSLEIRLLCFIFKTFQSYLFKDNKYFVIQIHTPFLFPISKIIDILTKKQKKDESTFT